MTRLFTCGLEAGSIAVWPFYKNVTVSTIQKRTGAYSMRMAGGDAYGQFTFPATKTEIFIRLGLYPESRGGYGQFLAILDSAAGSQITMTVSAGWQIEARLGGVAGAILGTGGQLVINTWTCIEIRHLVANVGGVLQVYQDGALIITFAGDTCATANVNDYSVTFGGASGTSNVMIGYYDDIAINDTAGAVNNSWIGRGGIYVKVMTGVGTYTDLHASAGNPWDCIDEVPPNDADYVYDDTVDQKSTYAGSTLTPTTGTIDCINVIMRAKLDAAGTGNIARLIRSNGVDSQGADVGLDTSPKTIQENIETDPSGGGAWTIARVNALEAGAVVR